MGWGLEEYRVYRMKVCLSFRGVYLLLRVVRGRSLGSFYVFFLVFLWLSERIWKKSYGM